MVGFFLEQEGNLALIATSLDFEMNLKNKQRGGYNGGNGDGVRAEAFGA